MQTSPVAIVEVSIGFSVEPSRSGLMHCQPKASGRPTSSVVTVMPPRSWTDAFGSRKLGRGGLAVALGQRGRRVGIGQLLGHDLATRY